MKYEEDLTEEERAQRGKQGEIYKHTRNGLKVVEAFLAPSAKTSCKETNKVKMLNYVYEKGYKVIEINNSRVGRLDLFFDNFQEANRCSLDKKSGRLEKTVEFIIPNRIKRCKGVITDWGLEASLHDLVDSMVEISNILEIERLKRRVLDKESSMIRENVTQAICLM